MDPLLDELAHLRTATASDPALREALRQVEAGLRQAQLAAEGATRTRQAFLANMSHELRTPLNAILGFAQLLRQDRSLGPEQHTHVDIIHRSGEQLLALINDLLELSRQDLDDGRASASCDLLQLVDDLEDMLYLRAERRGLRLRVIRDDRLPRYIRADGPKLRQLFLLLLGNAIKFARPGELGLRLACTVEDDGLCGTLRCQFGLPGLARADLEAFVRSSAGNQQSGIHRAAASQSGVHRAAAPSSAAQSGVHRVAAPSPAGLPVPTALPIVPAASVSSTNIPIPREGPSLAQELARALGGELEIGIGELHLDLPIGLVAPSDQPSTGPERRVLGLAPGQPTYRILVAEDRWQSRQLLVQMLGRIGFDVREASNGAEALELFQQWKPQLIWMDMRMPGVTGLEATLRIKRSPGGKETVVIALTASAFEEDPATARAAGCDDFVRKPIRMPEVFAKLREHLGVTYIYEDAAPVAPNPALDGVDLGALPRPLLTALHRACVQADLDEILGLIGQIRDTAPDTADILDDLARRFTYDRIIELTQAALEGGSP